MGEIVGSEVGRRFSPGFGSIRVFPRRRRRFPRWLIPLPLLAGAILVGALLAGR